MKFLPLLALLALIGCSPANSPAQVRADARAVVSLAQDAWIATGQVCVNLAVANSDQGLLDKCKSILLPARDSLIAAEAALDAWSAADQGNIACLVSKAVAGIAAGEQAVKDAGGQLPQLVDDAIQAAVALAAQCQVMDGGS